VTMDTPRRTSVLWGVILAAMALVLLLRALEVFPAGMQDILARSWPVLLVLAGLALLLPGRVPLGGLAALALSVALVGGVVTVAYSTRAGQFRDDQQQPLSQPVGAAITLVAVNIDLLATDIELQRAAGDGREIGGQFTGSLGSEIVIEYEERADGIGEFTLREEQPDQFPGLEAVGRGRLLLELPADVAVALALRGEDGTATFNMSDLRLERFSAELERGDVLITLPEYQPLSPTAIDEPGQIATREGNVTLFVPRRLAARLELNRGGNDIRPLFDPSYILIDDGADGTLEKRAIGADDIEVYYEITAPRGQIRLEVSPDA
jgi:hypothetical protein